MPPPLPVPSKAAIHALRGLALGTSCAIGVIVEDRRRRISTLRTAIANKKKLKASRQYHGARESVASQLDLDDAVPLRHDDLHERDQTETPRDPDGYPRVLLPRSTSSRKTTADAEYTQSPECQALNDGLEKQGRQAEHATQQSPVSYTLEPVALVREEQLSHTAPRIPSNRKFLVNNSANWGPESARTSRLRPKSFDPASLTRSIDEILSNHDEEKFDLALAKFFSAPQTRYMLQQVGDAWLDISARLSKECQARGRWEDAARVLDRVLDGGPLNESWYYAHDPFPIIESYLPPVGSEDQCTGDAFSKASRLFLATFTKAPQSNQLEVERLGKRLLSAALALRQFRSVSGIYWRVLTQLDDCSNFSAWVIKALSEYHDYKNVVKIFLLNFSKITPNDTLFNETLDRVVYAVEAMKGLKAAQVLRAYARMGNAGDASLRTRWIMKILQAHWHRHQDFSQSKALFDEAKTLGLLDRIGHPQGVYRVMVELALRADEHLIAKSYYDEVLQMYPELASDIPLQGYFALAKAKAGDWEGVYDDFTEMKSHRHRPYIDFVETLQEEYDSAFIMVLKVFAQGHPVSEIREFVTRYTRDLDVGLHRYVVTLVANKYGECHDMPGLISWLEYCSEAGFALDPSFCNAMLYNCRARWKLSFEQLKSLISNMRQLNPDATDDSTERLLSQASIAGSSKTHLSFKARQAHHKAVSVNKLAYMGRSTNNRDVYEAMNQEIGCGKHMAAVTIYKRAMRFGMPFCSYCFRLAVTAALELPGNGTSTAFHLIHNAHGQGQDVSSAVSAFIRTQMDRFRGGTTAVMQHIQAMISRFEALHIIIDAAVLTHTALVCIKFGQHARAISLCRLAMERSGSATPCFSRQAFRVLLMAYSQTLDAPGLEDLLAALRACDFAHEKKTLLELRTTLRKVQSLKKSPAAAAAAQILRSALDDLRLLRAQRQREGNTISQEALRIVGDAVAQMTEGRPRGGARDAGPAGWMVCAT
ncbi:hypothetical protein DL768_011260 [Monosporascus sp. mg162]|nr:hypothetical protein DL768_011260 [Monosporascus sp. mg162]